MWGSHTDATLMYLVRSILAQPVVLETSVIYWQTCLCMDYLLMYLAHIVHD